MLLVLLLKHFYIIVNLRNNVGYNLITVFIPATTIFRIFTREFLSMKGALGKYGGSSLVTTVSMYICMHPIAGSKFSTFICNFSNTEIFYSCPVGEAIEVGNFNPKIATFWIDSGNSICRS